MPPIQTLQTSAEESSIVAGSGRERAEILF
jgi:hypothetical protein